MVFIALDLLALYLFVCAIGILINTFVGLLTETPTVLIVIFVVIFLIAQLV